jgi:hypothetical protein
MQFLNGSGQKREFNKNNDGETDGTKASLPVDSGLFNTRYVCIGKVRMGGIENATAS